jgi:hypothetical protein
VLFGFLDSDGQNTIIEAGRDRVGVDVAREGKGAPDLADITLDHIVLVLRGDRLLLLLGMLGDVGTCIREWDIHLCRKLLHLVRLLEILLFPLKKR